jgi:hypothetical protein
MDSYIDSKRNQKLLQELLFDPDSVDFVVRRTEFFEEMIQNNEIAVSVILSGRSSRKKFIHCLCALITM